MIFFPEERDMKPVTNMCLTDEGSETSRQNGEKEIVRYQGTINIYFKPAMFPTDIVFLQTSPEEC
jgi:hypothetical protein